MDVAEIQLSVGGRLVLDVPAPGLITTPTVTLYSPNGAELVASQSADQWAGGTLNGAVAAKARTITLQNGEATGLTSGDRLVLVGSAAREWVRVRSISGDALTLYEPLMNAYADDTPVGSCRLTVEVDSTEAATLDEGYSARWAYQFDGVDRESVTWWDVTRCVWDEVLSTAEFRAMAGGLGIRALASFDADGLDYADDIAEAVDRVRSDLREKQLRPGLFRSAVPFRRAVFERVLLTWASRSQHIPSAWQTNPSEWLDTRRVEYGQALASALNNAHYDANEDGVVTATEKRARLGSVRIQL